MIRRRFVVVTAVVAVLAVGLTFGLARPRYVNAAPDQATSLAAMLKPGGITFEPLTQDELRTLAGTSTAPEDAAVARAVGQFEAKDQPILYRGRVSVADVQPPIVDRAMYVVQLTGQTLSPLGPFRTGPVPDTMLHHELIVFVDATTGAYIMAVTGR